ncbi:Esterase A [Hyphodiscus hymeniophilus]|uniref:feruloyl esterase n=1 Tax=Hyphodiscus hymeniophilus TaxID=353542 RepID=A0A9P6VMR0_9HELO|nr:Esterase A [Hyphodiscus hymeniophilus]
MFSKGLTFLPLLATTTTALYKPLPLIQAVGETTNVTILSSGINRTYLICIPPKYDGQTLTPVIFSFHGGSRNASQQQELSQFSNPDFNDFAISIYPQGIGETWQGAGNPDNGAHDVRFTNDMINQLESLYAIDPARIWASGKSDGGGFTNRLACDQALSQRIAAFAPVSGAFYVDDVAIPCDPDTVAISCDPGRPKIPILEFHGYKDHTIDYFGNKSRKGACVPSIPHWAQEWAARDGLSIANATTELPATNDTLIYTFGLGEDTGLVTQVTDLNLGHDWPSLVDVGDAQTADFDATPIIMEFFKKHSLA